MVTEALKRHLRRRADRIAINVRLDRRRCVWQREPIRRPFRGIATVDHVLVLTADWHSAAVPDRGISGARDWMRLRRTAYFPRPARVGQRRERTSILTRSPLPSRATPSRTATMPKNQRRSPRPTTGNALEPSIPSPVLQSAFDSPTPLFATSRSPPSGFCPPPFHPRPGCFGGEGFPCRPPLMRRCRYCRRDRGHTASHFRNTNDFVTKPARDERRRDLTAPGSEVRRLVRRTGEPTTRLSSTPNIGSLRV